MKGASRKPTDPTVKLFHALRAFKGGKTTFTCVSCLHGKTLSKQRPMWPRLRTLRRLPLTSAGGGRNYKSQSQILMPPLTFHGVSRLCTTPDSFIYLQPLLWQLFLHRTSLFPIQEPLLLPYPFFDLIVFVIKNNVCWTYLLVSTTAKTTLLTYC